MNSPRFREALVYACELHAAQTRKGTSTPYIAHLLAVASLVIEHGGDEEEAIAALLHDAVEDQGGAATRQEILQRFGERVARIVDECTDTDVQPKPPWRQRKEAYLAHLPSASASGRLVSAADKLHNVRSLLADYRRLGESLWQRFNGGREGTLWYYQELARILSSLDNTPLVQELSRAVHELHALGAQPPLKQST